MGVAEDGPLPPKKIFIMTKYWKIMENHDHPVDGKGYTVLKETLATRSPQDPYEKPVLTFRFPRSRSCKPSATRISPGISYM
jgi:hypothetical protein